MVNARDQSRPSAPGSIDELRIIATVLLVAFHVVGQTDSGLRIEDGHPARFIVDLGASFRMPAFAFVAGFIYCLRPPTRGHMRDFLRGKARRIALPGLIAAVLFGSVAYMQGSRFGIPPEALWGLAIFPYAHFWFLQAILALFIVVGLIDIALDHRGQWPMFAGALLLALWPPPIPTLFALPQAIVLAPFFIFGMCVYRSWAWIAQHGRLIVPLAAVAALLAFSGAFYDYLMLGVSPNTSIASSLLLGMSVSLLILLRWPHHPYARKVGQFSFTIYLYHVFATAGARMALHTVGIDALAIHLPVGILAGLLGPVALHLILLKTPVVGPLALGIRTKAPAPRSAPAPHVKARAPASALALPATSSRPAVPRGH
ncbi:MULTISPECIES: acyltransferase family protein [unclassified Sphingobium]|uniref:acyltransferase family protein n=1 Tax=unclassified Sphingobium TaxID=2611147 RepID=UPI002224F593|nr:MULTISPECIES: acyltransferase [unclassified Sphingobium]MCW2383092.1 peptidoglycan/LPS O-acetylase OafA/YrhL [Sphingobium sp. B2D3B]MCW2399932.1 peptidoglycan/LPS O-acetylase OafA/YrhL [Sphingobium sp. B2D3C]